MVCRKFILSFKFKASLDKDLKNDTSVISENIGVVYTGNPQILKNMSRCIRDNKTCRLLHDWKKMRKIIFLIPVFNDWSH